MGEGCMGVGLIGLHAWALGRLSRMGPVIRDTRLAWHAQEPPPKRPHAW